MLTGWPCTLFIHGWPDFEAEVLWATLCSSRDADFLMTCSTKTVQSSSLESGHVYSLINVYEVEAPGQGAVRLLKIRNPNSRSKWQGNWSDSSSSWTPQLRERLGCPKDGVPHVFFMDYDDFLKEFAHCTICRIRSNEWHEVREPVILKPGMPPTAAMVLEVLETTEISISLVQPSQRMRGGPFFPNLQGPMACLGFVVLRIGPTGEISTAAVADIKRMPLVSAECWLEPGRYLLVPLSLHSGPALTATWACFSSRRVLLSQRTLAMNEVRLAWAEHAKANSDGGHPFHGAQLHIGRASGGCIVVYAENPATNRMLFKVGVTLSSSSFQYARGQDTTTDWLSPGQGQILQFVQPDGKSEGSVSWSSTHTFGMTFSAPAGALHNPNLPAGDHLLTPFSLEGARLCDACTVQ